jgi:hypothetical protein
MKETNQNIAILRTEIIRWFLLSFVFKNVFCVWPQFSIASKQNINIYDQGEEKCLMFFNNREKKKESLESLKSLFLFNVIHSGNFRIIIG